MRVARFLPIASWLPRYSRDWLSADVIAGLTAAAVVIPYAMAYAAVAGLPVEAGIYTVLIPATIYAILGTSRALSTSTSTTLGILTAAAMVKVAPEGDMLALMTASSTLACLVGAILIAASVLRLGFVANFISDPVLTGFKTAIGLVIILDQIPKLLGIHVDKGSFLHNLAQLLTHLGEASMPTIAVALVMLVLLIALRHLLPRIPAPLVAVALGIAGSWVLDFNQLGIATIGHIPPGLPHFRLPNIGLVTALLPSAAGIALMSFTETITAGRAFASHEDPPLDANQELLATGLAGFIGGLFGGMPSGGGTSQTAVNRLAGARTQLSELITAAVAAAVLLFLSPLIGLMPQATLAAVVVVYSVGLIRLQELRAIVRVRHMEFIWAVTAGIGVILLGTLQGILAAVVVSLASLVHQVNNPRVYAVGRISGTDIFQAVTPSAAGGAGRAADELFPGLLIVRTEGRIYFANAQVVADKIARLIRETKPQVVLFDMGAIPDIEYTAIKMMSEGAERLAQRGIELWLSNLNPEVLETLKRTPLFGELGEKRIFLNRQAAVTYYLNRIADSERPVSEETPR